MNIIINNKEVKGYKLKKFYIESEFNDHTKLILELEVIDDIALKKDNDIEIIENNSIFKGKINLYKKETLNGVYNLAINAISYSNILDLEVRKRVFQDLDITYFDISKNILEKYDINYSISEKLKIKLKKMYVQYNETDLYFLKRILSDIDEVIYTSYNGIILVGLQDISSIVIKNKYIEGIKDENILIHLKDEIYLVGDKCKYGYIAKIKSNIEQGIYHTSLEILENIKGKKYKTNIQGAFIEAFVIELCKNGNIAKMKVDFSRSIEDNSKNKKELSFATPYSKTNTGFFVSPDIGDIVDVYFPTEDENMAKVAFCINNDSSSRFCDPYKRNFYNIEYEKNMFAVNIEKISFLASSQLKQESKGIIDINSKEDIKIFSNKIEVITKKEDIELKSSKDIILKGVKIHNN